MSEHEKPAFDVEVLRVQPGDVVAVKTKHVLSEHEIASIKQAWEAVWRGNPPASVIVLQEGMDLQVLRPGDAD